MPVLFKLAATGRAEIAEKVYEVFEDEWRIGTLRIQGSHTTGEFAATFEPIVDELCDHWIDRLSKFLEEKKKRWEPTQSIYYHDPAKRRKSRHLALSTVS